MRVKCLIKDIYNYFHKYCSMQCVIVWIIITVAAILAAICYPLLSNYALNCNTINLTMCNILGFGYV